jgi:glycerol-3-phosphate O-acyltransferase
VLSWILDAFVDAGRRDLFFVPIGISYERLVEEGSMVEELEGGTKSDESVAGLVRARRFLRNRFGSAHVRFGEPISVGDYLARHEGEFGPDGSAEARRIAIEELGNEIVERINWAMVATGTSVAACALLGGSPRGLFRGELVLRMREIVDLLRLQDVPMTGSLAGGESDFKESIAFLVRTDLVKISNDPRGEIIYFDEDKRRALDVYRNVVAHFLATPSFAARRILQGVSRAELRTDLQFWLEFFYTELFAPTGTVMALHVDGFLDYFERIGALEEREERLYPTEKGRRYFRFLAEQTRGLIESYYATFQAVLTAPDGTSERELEKATEEGFQRAQLLGEVERREAWTVTSFRNALELLVRREVLVRSEGDKPKERAYARGPRFDDLPSFLERLAASLGAL